MEPAELLASGVQAFAAARERAGGHDVDHLVAGRWVRLSFAGDGFAATFSRALAGRFTGDAPVRGEPALTIHAWDAETTGVRLPSDSWGRLPLGPLGVSRELSDGRYHVSMEVHAALASVLDRQTGLAVYYAPDPAFIPYWEVTHPARVMLAAWARAGGLLMCHAAAVGTGGRGVLLGGSSGSGKSTTALACLGAGMDCAGDDYVLVDPGPPPTAHALYTSALLEVGHARRHSDLMPVIDRVAGSGRSRSKAVTFASGDGRAAMRGGHRVVAIAAPRVEPGSATSFSRITAGAALRALAPSTLAQLGTMDAAGLADLANLCRSLPCFELRLGRDLDAIPGVVTDLLAEAGRSTEPRARPA